MTEYLPDLCLERLFLDESVPAAAKPLFVRLWRLCDRRPGILEGINVAQLATISGLSPRTVEYRLGLLRRSGLITTEGRDRLTITITDRIESLPAESAACDPAAFKPAKPTPLFDALEEEETAPEIAPQIRPEVADEVADEVREQVLPSYITHAHAGTPAHGFQSKERKKEKLLDLEVSEEGNAASLWRSLDWSREENAKIFWEVADALRFGRPDTPYLRAEVIYRFAAGIIERVPGFTLSAIRSISREADERVALWANPFTHRDGKPTRWETICSRGRLLWESAAEGNFWPATRPGVAAPIRPETEPEARQRPTSPPSASVTVDELIRKTKGLTLEEVGGERFAALDHAERRKIVIAAFQARGLSETEANIQALGVSSALLRIAKLEKVRLCENE